MKTNTYLMFSGNCEAALKFYEEALGAKIEALFRFGEAPDAKDLTEEQASRIMHARFQLGDEILMASDATPEYPEAGVKNGFFLSLNVESPEEAERLFGVLAEGGEVSMPMAETFWARRFGMLSDRFGTPWMVNCEKPMEA